MRLRDDSFIVPLRADAAPMNEDLELRPIFALRASPNLRSCPELAKERTELDPTLLR
jgi:hypothetical protein